MAHDGDRGPFWQVGAAGERTTAPGNDNKKSGQGQQHRAGATAKAKCRGLSTAQRTMRPSAASVEMTIFFLRLKVGQTMMTTDSSAALRNDKQKSVEE
jgi:hypothetical protein